MQFTKREAEKLEQWADAGVDNAMDGSVGERESAMRLIEVGRVLGLLEIAPDRLTDKDKAVLGSLFRPPIPVAPDDVSQLFSWARLLGRIQGAPDRLRPDDLDLLLVFSEPDAEHETDSDWAPWIRDLHERILAAAEAGFGQD